MSIESRIITKVLEKRNSEQGYGVSLHQNTQFGAIYVTSIVPNSAAQRNGVRPGWELVQVHGQKTKHLAISQVSDIVKSVSGNSSSLNANSSKPPVRTTVVSSSSTNTTRNTREDATESNNIAKKYAVPPKRQRTTDNNNLRDIDVNPNQINTETTSNQSKSGKGLQLISDFFPTVSDKDSQQRTSSEVSNSHSEKNRIQPHSHHNSSTGHSHSQSQIHCIGHNLSRNDGHSHNRRTSHRNNSHSHTFHQNSSTTALRSNIVIMKYADASACERVPRHSGEQSNAINQTNSNGSNNINSCERSISTNTSNSLPLNLNNENIVKTRNRVIPSDASTSSNTANTAGTSTQRNTSTTPPARTRTRAEESKHRRFIQRYVGMGIKEDMAEIGIAKCGYDFYKTLAWILKHVEEQQYLNDLNQAQIESELSKRKEDEMSKKSYKAYTKCAQSLCDIFPNSTILNSAMSQSLVKLFRTISSRDGALWDVLVALLKLETDSIKWYGNPAKCYVTLLFQRIDKVVKKHQFQNCCTSSSSSSMANNSNGTQLVCPLVDIVKEEHRVMEMHLFSMPTNHGGIPEAFLNADASTHYDIDNDGFELVSG